MCVDRAIGDTLPGPVLLKPLAPGCILLAEVAVSRVSQEWNNVPARTLFDPKRGQRALPQIPAQGIGRSQRETNATVSYASGLARVAMCRSSVNCRDCQVLVADNTF